MQKILAITITLACALANIAAAQERELAVLSDWNRFKSDASWVYNDLEKGIELARDSGKPLLVVIRCVP